MQNPSKKEVLLVDARTAAKLLAVSPRKLWAMTFEEKPGLPYVRCGRLVRYSPDDLRRWIEVRRLQNEAECQGYSLPTAAEMEADKND